MTANFFAYFEHICVRRILGHTYILAWCNRVCAACAGPSFGYLIAVSLFCLCVCVCFWYQSLPSVRWTNSVGFSWTAGRFLTPSGSGSLNWPSSGFDLVTSAGSCASPTAASARSWPATTKPAPSSRGPSEAASRGSPHPPWWNTYGHTSRETPGFLPGRSGTGYSQTGCATSSTCLLLAPSAGSFATRSGIWPSRASTSPASRGRIRHPNQRYPTTTYTLTRAPKCPLPQAWQPSPDTWPCTGYGPRRTP